MDLRERIHGIAVLLDVIAQAFQGRAVPALEVGLPPPGADMLRQGDVKDPVPRSRHGPLKGGAPEGNHLCAGVCGQIGKPLRLAHRPEKAVVPVGGVRAHPLIDSSGTAGGTFSVVGAKEDRMRIRSDARRPQPIDSRPKDPEQPPQPQPQTGMALDKIKYQAPCPSLLHVALCIILPSERRECQGGGNAVCNSGDRQI